MIICAHCIAAVPPGASFCPACGARLLQSKPGSPQDIPLIGYGCAGLVVLFFIGLWMLDALTSVEIVYSLLWLLEILIS